MTVNKRTAGQSFASSLPRASEWNALADDHEAMKQLRKITGRDDPAVFQQTAIFLVKNTTGGNVERFGVMGVGDPIHTHQASPDEFKSNTSFKGETPAYAAHIGRFCIALEPIAAGETGRCTFAGVTVAKLFVADEAARCAEIIAGNPAKLQAAASGSARILWKESGTGDKWGVVLLNSDFGVVLFQLTSNMALGGVATARVLQWDFGSSSYQPTGPGITVADPTTSPNFRFGGVTGFKGAATVANNGNPQVHEILWMESFAEVVKLTTTSAISSGAANASVNSSTRGVAPTSTVRAVNPTGSLDGFPAGSQFIAHLDDAASSANNWSPVVYAIDARPPLGQMQCQATSGWAAASSGKPIRVLHVRKNSSMFLWRNNADPTQVMIDIGGGPASSVFAQRSDGSGLASPPVWDTSPGVHSIQASNWLKVGHVFMVRPSGALLEQTWLLPKTAAGCKGRLYAENVSGQTAQLGWESPGMTIDGYMYFHKTDCDSLECRAVSFRRGMLMSIENETDQEPPCAGQVSADTTRPAPFDPCGAQE